MKIKTIWNNFCNAEIFDNEVNAALAEGWVLVKRECVAPAVCDVLYAELVWLDAPAKGGLMEAMKLIHQECNKYTYCRDCPLEDICDCTCPDNWRIGYAEEDDNG